FGRVGEQAGRLDDDLRAELLPGNVGRVALSGDLNFASVDDEGLFTRLDLARIIAVIAVVFEQVGVGRRVEQIVDADDLDVVGMAFEQRLEDLAPDSAEAVDAYAYCHWRLLSGCWLLAVAVRC